MRRKKIDILYAVDAERSTLLRCCRQESITLTRTEARKLYDRFWLAIEIESHTTLISAPPRRNTRLVMCTHNGAYVTTKIVDKSPLQCFNSQYTTDK